MRCLYYCTVDVAIQMIIVAAVSISEVLTTVQQSCASPPIVRKNFVFRFFYFPTSTLPMVEEEGGFDSHWRHLAAVFFLVLFFLSGRTTVRGRGNRTDCTSVVHGGEFAGF